MTPTTWVEIYESDDGSVRVESRDGLWHYATTPSWWCLLGRHRAHVRGWTRWFARTDRCVCGATLLDGRRPWVEDRGWRRELLKRLLGNMEGRDR